MLDFYCIGKQVKLSSGKILTIKRGGVGNYYRLLYAVIESNQWGKKLEIIKSDLDRYQESIECLAHIKDLNNQVSFYVGPFINIKWSKVPKEEKQTIIQTILKFNTYEVSGGVHRETTLGDIERENEFIINYLVERGYKIEEAQKVNNYQAGAMIQSWIRKRIVEMGDVRMATQALSEDYKKYISELQGFKSMTADQILKEV